MIKYCFEEQDMYCVLEWAIEAYKKWKNDGQPKCVDINKLYFYVVSSSVYTGKYYAITDKSCCCITSMKVGFC